MRFKKENDSYYDFKTGLEWSLQNYGPMSWPQAVNYCKDQWCRDFVPSQWRLPTIEELFSLIDYSKFNPATEWPDIKSAFYWSSNTNICHKTYAWYVSFYDGCVSTFYKTSKYYVRCVREKSRMV